MLFTHKIVLLIALPAFCALSLALQENYPFSHYPMYGDPDPVSVYYHLADGEGKPLPIEKLTGKSAPKLGKILRGHAERRAKELKLRSYNKLPPNEWQPICTETLAYLRQQAQVRKQVLPAKLRIMKTEIRYDGDKVVESPQVFFAE
jgi:hypothetical protein